MENRPIVDVYIRIPDCERFALPHVCFTKVAKGIPSQKKRRFLSTTTFEKKLPMNHGNRGQSPQLSRGASAWFLFLVVRCLFSTSKASSNVGSGKNRLPNCCFNPSPKFPHPVKKMQKRFQQIYPKFQEMCVF